MELQKKGGVPKYRALTDYMGELCKRTEAIRGKLVKFREDNMLKVSTDGRKAALHLKLVGQQQPEGDVSKVCQCVDRVTALYRQFPDATQLIFCDYSTPKSEKFNVYNEIKEKLIGQGIPEHLIPYIFMDRLVWGKPICCVPSEKSTGSSRKQPCVSPQSGFVKKWFSHPMGRKCPVGWCIFMTGSEKHFCQKGDASNEKCSCFSGMKSV
jgi:hypothetical protein